ncbi:hypothetical protein Fcan01_16649 [Folsomia candida]|uniref:Uncharacterized protein n=1 Tax=Folsomia candida TaxID=158441 RepID=A0A226DVJ5_FOLCA|nr:hypothetical protein Fcan01_16649 [Folsomia candida]
MVVQDIIPFAFCFSIYVHFTFTLTNFNHNPTCLLMSILRSANNQSDLTFQYDNHLSFAHLSGLVVKLLPTNVPISTFFTWKTNCIEIVAFYEYRNPAGFLNDLGNWGYRGNVLIYAVFSIWSQHNLMTTDSLSYLASFYAPIYIIALKLRGDVITVYTGFLHPTEVIRLTEWGIILRKGEVRRAPLFPSMDALTKERWKSDHNQNLYKLSILQSWVHSLLHYDCEDHRYFVSTGIKCFVVHGPLQVLRGKLNFTFAPLGIRDWYTKGFLELWMGYQRENLRLDIGAKHHIEKTLDYFMLYCQKNPPLLTLKISLFFTIIDALIWVGSILLSIFLGITKLGGYSDIAAAFVRVKRLTWFGLLCIVVMIAVSSSYDAIITTDITTPLEKYIVQNIRELLTEFGFKLYISPTRRNTTTWHLSARKLDDFVWKKEILPSHAIYNKFSGAAVFADSIAFDPTSDDVQHVLYHLKSQYTNVTCNIVKEMFYQRNIIWEFKYYGAEALYRNLQSLSSNGFFKLYGTLWKFVTEANIRKHPASEQESIGALENLFVAFQLYLVFIPFTILSFLGELAFCKFYLKILGILQRCKQKLPMPWTCIMSNLENG